MASDTLLATSSNAFEPSLLELSGIYDVASDIHQALQCSSGCLYVYTGRSAYTCVYKAIQAGSEAWSALVAAAARVAPGMNTQNVANTLSSFLTLAATRGRSVQVDPMLTQGLPHVDPGLTPC